MIDGHYVIGPEWVDLTALPGGLGVDSVRWVSLQILSVFDRHAFFNSNPLTDPNGFPDACNAPRTLPIVFCMLNGRLGEETSLTLAEMQDDGQQQQQQQRRRRRHSGHQNWAALLER